MSIEKLKESLKATQFVFVYGTLQQRNNKNHRHFKFSEFIGADTTEDKFILGDVGYPYAFPEENVPEKYHEYLLPVEGEVYKVKGEGTLLSLDFMEGYPNHYDRKIITTKQGHKCWMYIQRSWWRMDYCRICSITEEGNWKW